MTITIPKSKKVEDFICEAPDSAVTTKGVKKGNKLQISLTISSELLEQVDQLAKTTGQSRAGIINMAIFETLQSGLNIKNISV